MWSDKASPTTSSPLSGAQPTVVTGGRRTLAASATVHGWMSSPEIRDYRPGPDTTGLLGCIVELQEHERALEPSLLEGGEMAEAHLAYMLARCREHGGCLLVAVDGASVVGFVCLWARVPPEGPDDLPFDHAYVSDLAVLASHRNRGVGRALIDQAEVHARAAGAVLLRVRVRAHNDIARRLYAAVGFTDDQIELAKRLR
jgi:ribosomal protein S18 acetylase RimI-like enzyme